MTTETVAAVTLPQSYAITKSTPGMVALLRETFSNNKGKVYSVSDLQRLTGKKWVNGFIYYASRMHLNPNAPCDFPIVAVKKDLKVVGYIYQPLAGTVKRNAKGHPVKPTAIIGKWEAKLTQRAAEAAAAVAAAEAKAEAVEEVKSEVEQTAPEADQAEAA